MSQTTTFRGKIYDSIIETVGATPLVRFSNLAKSKKLEAEILGKLEFFNPLASVKDRIGRAMIEDAEKAGAINADTIIVEPTSGNTGIALAFICAAKGYRLILTMPDSMSVERRKMLHFLGAELVLTPAAEGMKGAINKATALVKENKNAIQLNQFANPANPKAHIETTAQEILKDTDGQLDYFISGVGTGGTLTGVGQVLKKHNPAIKIIAVEPEESPILSGGSPGPHKIQGIGAGFIPDVLQTDLIDEVITIPSADAFTSSQELAKVEGVPAGISSGAAIAAALKIAARPEAKGKRIVAILPSFAERYLSTPLFNL
ncbi:MAG: cysteine synthase A [Alphaproteobacteria bacterium]